MLCFELFILIISFCSIHSGKSPEYEFRIKYFNGAPDGVRKSILGVNGKFPGPTIRVKLGDLLTVNVINNIQTNEGTSIHWHGLEQYLTPFQDGPEQVTQCPIAPGTTMKYEFKVQQSGTYWWHSHHSYQYTEGCWGALIVENPEDPHRDLYDEEIVVMLNDWYHLPGNILSDWHLSGESNGFPPFPNSGMINGLGTYDCRYAKLENRTCNAAAQYSPVFQVVKGKRYRFRVINTSAFVFFKFSIDGHQLVTIEVDGVDTVKVAPVDAAILAPAQRYSFVVAMDNPTDDKFWMRSVAQIDPTVFKNNINPYPEAFRLEVLGIVQYNKPIITTKPKPTLLGSEPGVITIGGASLASYPESAARPTFLRKVQGRPATRATVLESSDEANFNNTLIKSIAVSTFARDMSTIEKVPDDKYEQPIDFLSVASLDTPKTSSKTSPTLLNQNDCRPYVYGSTQELAPAKYHQNFVLQVDVKTLPGNLVRGTINGIVYKVGAKPVLFQVLKGEQVPEDSNPMVTTIGDKKVVQLVINSRDNRPHPFHLHGHSFYVLGTGEAGVGDYAGQRDKKKLILNGVRRDTIAVKAGSWAVIRYYADNPGVWLFHCHNNWHFQAGLGMVLIEGGHKFVRQAFGTRLAGTEGVNVCQRAKISVL